MEIKDNKTRGKHQTTPHYKASIAQKGRDKKQFKVLGTQINKLGLKTNSLLCISPPTCDCTGGDVFTKSGKASGLLIF